MIYKFMKDHRREFPVEKMCKVFKVSRSSFYEHWHRLPSDRDNENRLILFEIRRIHEKSKSSYGSPRITAELKARGSKVSRPRVARLMRQAGIRSVHAKKFVATTDSKHRYPIVENRLKRNFTTEARNCVWVSDITYVRTIAGWLYLTIVMDLFDRKVIGWAMSRDMSASNTTIAAWKMAASNRPITSTLIFHSDRGVQYACHEFADLLKSNRHVQRSMSRKGDRWDNAVAESFFKSLKVEHVRQNRFQNRSQAAVSIFEWVETWYNKNRRHSALGNLTIQEFENETRINNAA